MKSAILIILLITLVHKSFQSPIDSQKNEVKNVDISIGLSCALNSSCIENVSNRIVRALKAKSSLDFGIFQIEPLVKNGKETEGRSLSKVWDFINGNSIRIPFGKYSVNLQRSAEHDNSLEFFIGQTVEGRGRHERKTMQFFVPAFLVASQVGWWLLALAGVSLLAIKAFLVSKLALAFGVIMTLKKLFEHHHGMPHYYEHHEPLMVPYNFDMSGYGGPSAFQNDLHAPFPIGHESAALHQSGALGSESSPVATNVTGSGTPAVANNAPGITAYSTVARHPPLNYFGKSSYLFRRP